MAKKKYGRKAGEKVGRALHEMKEGTLRSGGDGRKVKNRKQAIAIGLSEARREGGKVPRKKAAKRAKAAKKSTRTQTTRRKSARKKS